MWIFYFIFIIALSSIAYCICDEIRYSREQAKFEKKLNEIPALVKGWLATIKANRKDLGK